MIIGEIGKIGSGKNTVADYIKEEYEYKEYSMADPLKRVGKILRFTDEQLYGTQEQKLETNKYWNISARHFLQTFGTEVCRNMLPKAIPNMNLAPSLWIRLMEIHMQESEDKCWVIPDVRFQDEVDAIRKLGGVIVKIDRKTSQTGAEHSHASELEMEKIVPDFVIDNNGTLEDLHANIDEFMQSIKQPKVFRIYPQNHNIIRIDSSINPRFLPLLSDLDHWI